MAKRVTNDEEFRARLSIDNPSIEPLSPYIKSKIPILVRCKECGYEWWARPNSLLCGSGCPRCSGKERKTTERFVEEVYNINPRILILSPYVNIKTKVYCLCLDDGYLWWAWPTDLLKGVGCPRCANREPYTDSAFKDKLALVHDDIINTEPYKDAKTPIEFLHQKCGKTWYAPPKRVLFGHGCPFCNESKGEAAITEYLESHNIMFIHDKTFDDCKYVKKLRFDFYIPFYNLVIEYDGIQHMQPSRFGGQTQAEAEVSFKKQQEKDAIKDQYCLHNNIKMIRIPHTQYDHLNNILDELFA